ncbi:MAG: hypothetical protein PHW04_11870 [Candidatus Wallbacteria bacterium]|nr:hypothetical protein [Candidatus Wallbacteria bacterium]
MKKKPKKILVIIFLVCFVYDVFGATNESFKSFLFKCNENELKQLADENILNCDPTVSSIINKLKWAYGNAITGPFRYLYEYDVSYSEILKSVAKRMKIEVDEKWDESMLEAKIFDGYLDAMWSGLSAEQKQQVLKNIAAEIKSKGIDPKDLAGLFTSGSISAIILYITSLGFEPFLALSTTIHAIGVVIGITFPFVIYTSAAHLLSVLTGPVGWGIAITAGLWYVLNTDYTTLTKFIIAKHVIGIAGK